MTRATLLKSQGADNQKNAQTAMRNHLIDLEDPIQVSYWHLTAAMLPRQAGLASCWLERLRYDLPTLTWRRSAAERLSAIEPAW